MFIRLLSAGKALFLILWISLTFISAKPCIGQDFSQERSKRIADSDIAILGESHSLASGEILHFPDKKGELLLIGNIGTPNQYGIYGTQAWRSPDAAYTWIGDTQEGIGFNVGAASALISSNKKCFVLANNANFKKVISISSDRGVSWDRYPVGSGFYIKSSASKLIEDPSSKSPYSQRLYAAWIGLIQNGKKTLYFTYSMDQGLSWSPTESIAISIQTEFFDMAVGENGVIFLTYMPISEEDSQQKLIMMKSTNGGVDWDTPTPIIFPDNFKVHGLHHWNSLQLDMDSESTPSLIIDQTNGPFKNRIYLAWSQIEAHPFSAEGVSKIYCSYSDNQGESWSIPKSINQSINPAFRSLLPKLCIDPINGWLYAVYYSNQDSDLGKINTYCAQSIDGGDHWKEKKVSDINFKPAPLNIEQSRYFENKIGITAYDGWVYPIWTDNRSGFPRLYVSPFQMNQLQAPTNLKTSYLNEKLQVNWEILGSSKPLSYQVLFGLESKNTSQQEFFKEQLSPGIYNIGIAAVYEGNQHSDTTYIQYSHGNSQILSLKDTIKIELPKDFESSFEFVLKNNGSIKSPIQLRCTPKQINLPELCEAGGGEDEFIRLVDFAGLHEYSGSKGYHSSNKYAEVKAGQEYKASVLLGRSYFPDQVTFMIDWNRNGNLNEYEFTDIPNHGISGNHHEKIEIHNERPQGLYRLRIRMRYGSKVEPCGNTVSGEVEDYLLWVNNWLSLYQNQDVIEGNSQQNEYLLINTNGLYYGYYYANVEVDLIEENKKLRIPIQLKIGFNGGTSMELETDKIKLCGDEEAHITCITPDKEGNIYQWRSIPPGFFSNQKDISVSPKVHTSYILTIENKGKYASRSIYIERFQKPMPDLGPDTIICAGTSYKLNAGDMFGVKLDWSDGSNKESLTVDSTGIGYNTATFWVKAENFAGCIAYDSIQITFKDCSEGIDETALAGLRIHPNPSHQWVWLEDDEKLSGQEVDICVYDVYGRICIQQQALSLPQRISMEELDAGSYFIRIQNKENQSKFFKIIHLQ